MPSHALACALAAALAGGPLLPSLDDEKLARERAVGEEIARTLELVPGVAAARVHVRLAERGLLLRGAAEPGAVAVVRVDARNPSKETLEAIVAGALPGIEPRALRIVVLRDEAAPEPAVVRVGPFSVAAGSAFALRAALGAAFAVVAILSIALILAGLRLRRLRERDG